MKKIHESGFWMKKILRKENDYGNISQIDYIFSVGKINPNFILWRAMANPSNEYSAKVIEEIMIEKFAKFLIKVGNDILRTQKKLSRSKK